jgi:pyrimidine operon attenuation protein/uracil phosphoribosyltransferase
MEDKILLLDRALIAKKRQRMAFQIWEYNSGETDVTIIGIEGSGMVVARSLAARLESISPLRARLVPLMVNKKSPVQSHSELPSDLDQKAIILVDDVVDSGRTMMYALRPILNFMPKRLLTAALVDRKHKSFPVATDIIGHTVATTLQDHIEVITEGDEVLAAYLQ